MDVLYIDARAGEDQRAADEASSLVQLLALLGYDVEFATDYERALAAVAARAPRTILVRVYTAVRRAAFAFPGQARTGPGAARPRLVAVVNPYGGGTTPAEAVAAGYDRAVEVGAGVAALTECLGEGDGPGRVGG